MISIKDHQGVVHKTCPRCDWAWEYIDDEMDYSHCTNDKCGMIVCRSQEELFFLSVEVGKYTLYWNETGTMVEITDTGEPMDETDTGGLVEKRESTYLPTLPFDISLDKLKTYLVFG